MFGAKRVNTEVIKMHGDTPYIETTVTFVTPIDKNSELYQKLVLSPNAISSVMEELNNEVEEKIGENFEADVTSLYCGVKNLYK